MHDSGVSTQKSGKREFRASSFDLEPILNWRIFIPERMRYAPGASVRLSLRRRTPMRCIVRWHTYARATIQNTFPGSG
jgi:hypothetical protein